jgi:hypothetical protein
MANVNLYMAVEKEHEYLEAAGLAAVEIARLSAARAMAYT